jgi:magnesium-protoporphyrin IX monomethyl ester (oxidative) cyclase
MLVFPPIINTRFTNNNCCLPMGIASLAAYLRDRIEVVALDAMVEGHNQEQSISKHLVRFGLSLPEIQRRIESFKPDILGVSTIFSSQFPIVREIISRAKAADPDLVTVTGGTHPSFLPEACLESSDVDFIILGEGEKPFSALIDRLQNERPFDDIPGIAFRGRESVIVNRGMDLVEDLDTLPYPARDLFPVEEYFRINLPMQGLSRHRRNISVATSRGCPYRCTFCSSTIHWGHKWRKRSPESVLDELEMLKSKYDLREVKFEDDNLTFDADRAKAIFRGMIERKFNFHWNTPNGVSVWTLDDEMLSLMKQSGCYEITLAIESGDEDVLKNIIKKPLSLDKARDAAERIKAHGIETSGYFIVGFPGETRKQIHNTVRFAKSLDLDRYYLFLYTPLPGTPLAKKAEDEGLILPGFEYENANNYFAPSVRTPDMSPEELLKLERREFWKMNLAFPVKHPVKFIRKYKNSLRDHPEFILKFFRALLQ